MNLHGLWRFVNNSSIPEFMEDILCRALSCDWFVKKIHEPFILEFEKPRGCEENKIAFATYSAHERTGFQAQYLICIPNGIAAGGGFVQLPSGEFLTESTWRIQYMLGAMGENISRARLRRHSIFLKGNYYYLDGLFLNNYGHWFEDELPRLYSALPYLPADTKFIVSEPCQDFKIQSLAALGISQDRLLPAKGYFKIHCEHLWFATHLGHTDWGTTSPAVLKEVRTAMLNAFSEENDESPEKIYVSRGAFLNKRLRNEEELLPIIKNLGFTIVSPELLSFSEQIRIFLNAKIVLGVYGAALTNAIFAPPGCMVLELQDSHHAPRLWYWKYACMLEHRYSTLIGLAANTEPEYAIDFTIHPDSLKQFLDFHIISENEVNGKQWWVSK